MVCPTCSNLCIAADDYANLEEGERLRARSLVDDLGTIGFAAKFPAFGRGFAILFSDGVLYSYAFYIVSRVSDGDLRPVMPDFSEMSDLARPLSLAFLAFVISWTPFFAAMYGLGLTRPAADPQPLAWLLVGLAGLWGLIYTPAAVTVAALTERMGSTLNPTLGIFAIPLDEITAQNVVCFREKALNSDGR